MGERLLEERHRRRCVAVPEPAQLVARAEVQIDRARIARGLTIARGGVDGEGVCDRVRSIVAHREERLRRRIEPLRPELEAVLDADNPHGHAHPGRLRPRPTWLRPRPTWLRRRCA
jgi:hypothetical protein